MPLARGFPHGGSFLDRSEAEAEEAPCLPVAKVHVPHLNLDYAC